jgi:predicted Zn-dependent peptidase
VISENIPHFRSISLGFWVPVGSRDEDDQNNGITHLIEHLIFKGTRSRSYRDIAIEFDAMGAEFNAFTDKEYCCIYADFIDENLPRCIDLLLDIVCSPSFLTEHVKTEKRVILEEIKMMEDNPSDIILNHFYSEVFEGHPLSLPILGTRKTLRKINKKAINNYFSRKFGLTNMVISAAGNIEHNLLVDMIKKYSEKTDSGEVTGDIPVEKLPENCTNDHSIHYGKSKAVHMCLGGLGCDRKNRDRYPLSLFTNLLGGSMSSRLFQKVREEEGLAYSISASNIQYRDTGMILIYSASSAKNVKKILKLIKEEIDDIRNNNVNDGELERARENMKGNIVLAVEDISSRMFRLGKTLLFDKKVLTIDQILKKIDSIEVSDINNIVEKYFNPENLRTIILGKNTEGIK